MRRLSLKVGASLVGLLVIFAIFAPLLSFHPPLKDFPGLENLKPFTRIDGKLFLLGTDSLGRDLWSRIVYGSRYTLVMSIGAVLLASLIGVPLGAIAGFYPKADRLLSRMSDILMAFPSLLIAIIIVAILGPGFVNAIVAVGLVSVVPFFKLSRTQFRSESLREYIQAAKALGLKDFRILFRHIFPNALSPLLVLASLTLGAACLESAALSFLNLGVSPPTPEWGSMIRSGMDTFLSVNPWVSLASGLAIFFTVLGFNLLGDALRDWRDPKTRLK